MNKPYIGITGFMNREQVQAVLDQLDLIGFPSTHRLMVGVLVSPKSLRREALKDIWRNKYPDPYQLGTIFVRDPRALNLVHYNTKEPNLADQLARVVDLTPNIDGFQLNIVWPDPAELRLFRERHSEMKIVLQIGPKVLASHDSGCPQWLELHDRLRRYRGLVDYLLLDGSGGVGIELDTDYFSQIIFGLSIFSDIRFMLGIAGGLSEESVVRLISPVLKICPDMSWDAQGCLRTLDDQLDLEKCTGYLAASSRLIEQCIAWHEEEWGMPPKFPV